MNETPAAVRLIDDGAELMLRIGSGDHDAFGVLVDRYQRSIFNTVLRYVGNRAVAEELTQDVFVRMFRAAPGYEKRARFETWMHRIIFNLCANAAEYRRRRDAVSLDASPSRDDDPRIDVTDDGDPGPLDSIEEREVAREVRSAIRRLPPQQRAAILMSRYQGMSCQEIGAVLGASVEAVKSLLFRARDNLKQTLTPYLGEEAQRNAVDDV